MFKIGEIVLLSRKVEDEFKIPHLTKMMVTGRAANQGVYIVTPVTAQDRIDFIAKGQLMFGVSEKDMTPFNARRESPVLHVDDLSTGKTTEISGEEEAVNHPGHYQGPHECIEVMEALFGKEAVKHFCMCNAFKYRFRAGMKNGEEDIKKAEWYEEYLIKMGGIDNDPV